MIGNVIASVELSEDVLKVLRADGGVLNNVYKLGGKYVYGSAGDIIDGSFVYRYEGIDLGDPN